MSYVNVLTPSTSEPDLIWRCRYGDDQVKIRLLGWALIQYDQYPWDKEKFRHRDRNTHRKMLHECDFRVWSDASTGKGTPKSVSKPPEAIREESDRVTALRRT